MTFGAKRKTKAMSANKITLKAKLSYKFSIIYIFKLEIPEFFYIIFRIIQITKYRHQVLSLRREIVNLICEN